MTSPPPGSLLLLHGHGRLGASLFRVAARARRQGLVAIAPNYPYRRPMAEIVARLAPRIAAHLDRTRGPVHLVTHSMGGLVARALIAAGAIPRDRLGRVVMLGPPNAGSELADLLIRLRLDRLVLGRAGPHLRTGQGDAAAIDFDLGIIAGDRALAPVLPRLLLPGPSDGKVTIVSTRLAGMADHIVLPVTHTLMVYDTRVIDQVFAFIREGRFTHRAGG